MTDDESPCDPVALLSQARAIVAAAIWASDPLDEAECVSLISQIDELMAKIDRGLTASAPRHPMPPT